MPVLDIPNERLEEHIESCDLDFASPGPEPKLGQAPSDRKRLTKKVLAKIAGWTFVLGVLMYTINYAGSLTLEPLPEPDSADLPTHTAPVWNSSATTTTSGTAVIWQDARK